MSIDDLCRLVSSAIWRAEQMESGDIRGTQQAWSEVSVWEEMLADAREHSEAKRRVAERGAVRAALKAGEYERARSLAGRFLSSGVSKASDLDELFSEDDQRLTARFPFAFTQGDSPADFRGVAEDIAKRGPFRLGA